MLHALALKLSGQFLYLAIRGIAFDFKNCFKNIDGLRYEFLAHFFWRIFKSIHGFGKIITTMGEHNARLFEILDLYVLLHSHALKFSDPIFELRTLLIEFVAMPPGRFFDRRSQPNFFSPLRGQFSLHLRIILLSGVNI